MSTLSQGQTASLVLSVGDSYTISSAGTVTVRGIYGAPSTTTTITASFATFGPYAAPAKLDVVAASGPAEYAIVAPTQTPVSGGGTGAWPESISPTVPMLALRTENNWRIATVPSPYSPQHVVHPSALHFEQGWNGYRYWMAFTPYPNSDVQKENVCICVSNDAVNWIVPTGLTNPIFVTPGAPSYLSDTDIYYDEPNNQIVMIFREVGPTTIKLRVTASTDGITWPATSLVYTGTASPNPVATDIVAPNIWYNATSSKWEIVGINITDTTTAWPLVKITSTNLLTGWDTSFTTLALTHPVAGRKFWHAQLRRRPDGVIVGITSDNNNNIGSTGSMYSLISYDGVNFYSNLFDTSNTAGWYRPSFVLYYDTRTGKNSCMVFGSKLNTIGMFVQLCDFELGPSKEEHAAKRSALWYGIQNGYAPEVVHADNFNRADDAAGLGTSTSLHTYTQLGGAALVGISSNQACAVTTGNCRAIRDVGQINYVLRYTIAVKTAGECYAIVAYIDSGNYTRIGISSPSSTLVFQRITAGGIAVNTALTYTPIAGDEIIIVRAGAQYQVFVNQTYVATIIDGQGATSTTVGLALSTSTTGVRIDNFMVTRA